jgi:signal transduction histidine kinase/CheY-like chemotaxis protein
MRDFPTIRQELLNCARARVYVADAQTYELLFVNGEIAAQPDEQCDAIGRLCWQVIGRGQSGPCDACPADYLKRSAEKSISWQDRDAAGRLSFNTAVLLEHPGDRTLYIHNSVDITGPTEAELPDGARPDDLASALREAERANRAKSDFLSRMSHEMRTPLNSIIGMTNIAMSSEDDDRRKDCLKRIENASNQLMGVINNILDMSKIEAEEFNLSSVEFDIELMIDRILSITGYEAEKKNQKIRIYSNSDIPRLVVGDEIHLSQALTNILSNAVKFTPAGGNIVLNIWQDERIQQEEGELFLTFEVIDDGIGISREQQRHLFDSREQSAAYRPLHGSGGSGLGLAITKRLVNMMEGEIEVESSPGAGSTFRFTVRLRAGSSRSGEGESAFISMGKTETSPLEKLLELGPRKILLAEDVEVNREIIALFFENTDFRLDFAENGEHALALFEQNNGEYDLVLMDIQMPVMDGYEATKRIRASSVPGAGAVPIVAMTANVFKDDIERCKEIGMNGHIGKPMVKDELFEKIAGILEPALRRQTGGH